VLSLAPGAAFARLPVVVSLDRFINITRPPRSCQAFCRYLFGFCPRKPFEAIFYVYR
jgi:hypothetical protein